MCYAPQEAPFPAQLNIVWEKNDYISFAHSKKVVQWGKK